MTSKCRQPASWCSDLVLRMQGAQVGHGAEESHGCAQIRGRVTTKQGDDDLVHLENVLQSVTLKNKVQSSVRKGSEWPHLSAYSSPEGVCGQKGTVRLSNIFVNLRNVNALFKLILLSSEFLLSYWCYLDWNELFVVLKEER